MEIDDVITDPGGHHTPGNLLLASGFSVNVPVLQKVA